MVLPPNNQLGKFYKIYEPLLGAGWLLAWGWTFKEHLSTVGWSSAVCFDFSSSNKGLHLNYLLGWSTGPLILPSKDNFGNYMNITFNHFFWLLEAYLQETRREVGMILPSFYIRDKPSNSHGKQCCSTSVWDTLGCIQSKHLLLLLVWYTNSTTTVTGSVQ